MATPEDDILVSKQPLIINSGAWGCGAFGGDHDIKFVQQWIAATMVPNTAFQYNTFRDAQFSPRLEAFVKHCHDKQLTQVALLQLVKKYQIDIYHKKDGSELLFDFIMRQ